MIGGQKKQTDVLSENLTILLFAKVLFDDFSESRSCMPLRELPRRAWHRSRVPKKQGDRLMYKTRVVPLGLRIATGMHLPQRF